MTIYGVYRGDLAGFPADGQSARGKWYRVGDHVVDADAEPTLAQVEAHCGLDAAGAAARQAELARSAGIAGDAERVALLGRLRTATAAQIDSYVDANVTDMASAKALFKRILKVLAP